MSFVESFVLGLTCGFIFRILMGVIRIANKYCDEENKDGNDSR